MESEYYSCNNDTSFNTTIYNEPSLSLSFIMKDDKGIFFFFLILLFFP